VSQISAPARNGKVIGRIPVQEKFKKKREQSRKTTKQYNNKTGHGRTHETLYEKSGRAG
jgi:hypothetical protein